MKFVIAAFFGLASTFKLEQAEVLGLDGYRWNQAFTPDPDMNYCTNANKATGNDQACSDTGNSAWNTHTSSITKKPTLALTGLYPDHPGVTYGVKGEVYPEAVAKK